jgi:hypothetical protein
MTLLYEGWSLLDVRAPVMVAATFDSDNRKTGPMVQLWIMRTDVHPFHAVRTREDAAICGDCMHRGSTCYVTVQHAPAAIYRAFKAGSFERRDAPPAVSYLLQDRHVRVGAYGDPAAVPVEWWETILRRTEGWTAYTHQWRHCNTRLQKIAMASVDSVQEMFEAQAMGWRTYRVRTSDSPLLRETSCPASQEMNHRSTCINCLLCDGRSLGDHRPSISILAHGPVVQFYRSRQQVLPLGE